MKKYSKIELFNLVRKLRDKFKLVNQISYNLSQVDKRFPFADLEEKSFIHLLEVYISFYKELEKAQQEILQILNEKNENTDNMD